MSRRREAMRRLGAAPFCPKCGRSLPEVSPYQDAVCWSCHEKDVRARIGAAESALAVIEADRPSEGSYRDACAAMQDDVSAALEDWPMGNGIVGQRH